MKTDTKIVLDQKECSALEELLWMVKRSPDEKEVKACAEKLWAGVTIMCQTAFDLGQRYQTITHPKE